jgi:hypothetical protein
MAPIEIFCCYAHEDQLLLNKLKAHLIPLQRQGLITLWADTNIGAGIEWESEINKHLNSAQIILLLVSPDFMSSEYCYSIEMKRAIERHECGVARVIPIILRPVYWQQAPFGKLQALPQSAKPITDPDWHDIDRALYNVTEAIYKTVEELPKRHSIEFSIEQGDITSFNADVLALKYAQEFFKTDKIIAYLLEQAGIDSIENIRPNIGEYRYLETKKSIQASYALFVGVPDLFEFTYQDIQEFAAQALKVLANIAPTTKHLAMTIHGANFGLDEIEALLSQFKGYIQALQSEQFPSSLEKITIIDVDLERIQRLKQAFDENFSYADFVSKVKNGRAYCLDLRKLNNTLNNQSPTGVSKKLRIELEEKSHIFVAMSSKKDLDDLFFFGIQQPVRAAGFVCERIEQDPFIDNILDQVKKKIETAVVVIAEMSDANPHVYLEVGYAWGKGRPTILLMKDKHESSPDVPGQRCLKYERIRDLEESLKKELKELKSTGFIHL